MIETCNELLDLPGDRVPLPDLGPVGRSAMPRLRAAPHDTALRRGSAAQKPICAALRRAEAR